MQSRLYLGENQGFLVEPRFINFGRILTSETSLAVAFPLSELVR